MTKQISIIIPCYNVEQYIERCFRSIVSQTIGVEQLEIILVDDCSTDGTWEKLRALEADYPDSALIIRCDENGRQGRARNIGMEYASAPYIGFIDADDWIEPDMYEKMYERIREQDCDIVMCQSYRDHGEPDEELPPKRTGRDDRCLEINTIDQRRMFLACGSIEFGPCNKLYRRELILDNGIYFPEKLAYEDHFFGTLLYFYTQRVYIIEERLYHYYINPKSTVLSSNASHHFDILAVDAGLWDECERRGFLTDYRQELEYQFLSLCYLMSFKVLLLRMGRMPYEYFLRLKEETIKRVPDYHANKCVQELVTDTNKILLELLDKDLTQEQFDEICTLLRGYLKQGKLAI